MVQREGRILRRGNQYQEIKIFRYIAEGSFDSYSWQLLETKQRFISQFLSGSEYQRSASDLEENVLTYAQVKALAISQPLMKVLAEKENELRRRRNSWPISTQGLRLPNGMSAMWAAFLRTAFRPFTEM